MVADTATVSGGQAPAASSIPEQALRTILLALSRRRSLGRLATSMPVTRPIVGRFVAGQDLDEVLGVVAGLTRRGFGTTLDVLGESVSTTEAARAASVRYLEVLDALVASGLERNVSLKLTQMGLDVNQDLCEEVVGAIVRKAEDAGAFVRIDMEDHTKTSQTLEVVRRMRAIHPDTGVVIQAALRRSAADIEQLIAQRTSVRLCKGAYKEPAAVAFPDKADVDASYAKLMESLIVEGTRPALATHDPRLINRAVEIMRRNGVPKDRVEFQMLFGVRRDLQEQLQAAGYRVRVYVPFGAEWYPYFMRRLAERPANMAFMLRSVSRDRGSARG